MPLIQVTSGGQRSILKKVCESQKSCLFVGDQILIFHHNLQINSLKILQCDFLDFFSSHFVCHSWSVPMMKITGLSHVFKWENLYNWWLTKYFFCPTVYLCFMFVPVNFVNSNLPAFPLLLSLLQSLFSSFPVFDRSCLPACTFATTLDYRPLPDLTRSPPAADR